MKSAVSAMTLYGWRMLIEPSHLGFGYGKTEPPLPYMIDNGAWGSFNRGVPWDGDRFIEMLDMWASGADMIVLPDIVGGGDESLARSVEWLPKVAEYGIPMLLAVQDGMVVTDVQRFVRRHGVGLFIGGSTEWKESTLPVWGRLAAREGCWLHVARVNSVRRIRLCQLAGAHSFDGTSVTKFPESIRRLDHARRQPALFSA
jgi:hypothetical protein